MAYLLYLRKIIDNFSEMSNAFMAISKVRGASYKVAELIINPPKVVMAVNGKKESGNAGEEGTIDVKGCTFAYPTNANVTVLKNVTISAPSNKVLAFVGSSGCGKSSIMKLIERFYDPDEGKLLYNEIDLKEIDNKWFHQT